MTKAQMGLIGLAVMGANLARNIARNEIKTLVYNRTASKTQAFIEEFGNEYLEGAVDLAEFAAGLVKPRRILMMVKAGEPVDQLIKQLLPHLEAGDILIDGGNSFYEDTMRRTKELAAQGIVYVGMGISGGEEGALNGPSLMPGGSAEAYAELEPVLKAMAAKAEGEACVTHIGTDGAGHYVKMVHNGIEYADMQLIADTYSIMKNALGMTHEEMQATFEEWNKGRLNSYLIEITAKIMGKKDADGDAALLEKILDVAGQKGTGKWTSITALELGVPVPTITEAVYARYLSSYKQMRLNASKIYGKQEAALNVDRKAVLADLEAALYAAKICAYAQGFALMAAAGKEFGWQLDFAAIAKIWRNGCIIRAGFLNTLSAIFSKDSQLENLLLDEHFSGVLHASRDGWCRVLALAKQAGVAVPGLSSALEYLDTCATAYTSANLIQAQRDFFGAHTYERTDKEGVFHTEWEK